jgi:superfamily II DNA/RNA helicase
MEMHLHRCGRTARTGQEGPFFVTCVVDTRAEDVAEDVARALGVKRRYARAAVANDDADADAIVDER